MGYFQKILTNSLLIIKIHPMQDLNDIKVHDYSNIKLLNGKSVKILGVENDRLMKDADALIGDYSSAAYDFMHLDRPVGFTMDDAKEYKLGFFVDNPIELIGGQIIKNVKDYMHFINDVLNNRSFQDKC